MLGSATIGPTSAGAQTTAAAADSSNAEKRLFTGEDAIFAGAFAVTTVLLFPIDKRVARQLQNPGAQANNFFRRASVGFEAIASPGAYYIGGSMYLVGRVTKSSRLAGLGLHGTEAVLLAEGIVNVLKGATGRARPYVSDAQNPGDFDLGGGWRTGGRRSFPSGHTATAFAAAAAVTSETAEWWPDEKWLIGTAMFGGATMVGLSRMYNNRHWASDVALGALIGTFAGWKVVDFTHGNPNNRVDRVLLGMIILPHPDGIAVAWRTR